MPAPQPSRRSATSLRPIGMPRLLEVNVDSEGEPGAVARTDVRGRQGAWLTVETVEEQWRITESWWRTAAQERTYYRLRLTGGRLLTLFHDDRTGAWFEQPYAAPGETQR